MAVIVDVFSYEVRLLTPSTPARAVLRMVCSDGWTATYQFSDAPAAVNSLSLPGKSLFAFESISRLGVYLDILRNEKPLRLQIDTASPFRVVLITGNEPIGEGET